MTRAALALILVLFAHGSLAAQGQRADAGYEPDVPNPRWPSGDGPLVLIDEAHNNFHTVSGRYGPFADLLRADGWRVEGSKGPFTREALDRARVLVIANAINEANLEDWSLPTPSAFTPEEIAAVHGWVEDGGSLLLIADHMPFPGAAHELGAAFGFEMRNGFAVYPPGTGTLIFRRSDGSLGTHPVTDGRSAEQRVDSVATFMGQGFRPPEEAVSLLTFSEGAVSLEPETAWEFEDDTPMVPIGGWSQGAVLELGSGRLAVWGEAAGLTAQVGGPGNAPMGMSLPEAGQNARMVLNLIGWLAEP